MAIALAIGAWWYLSRPDVDATARSFADALEAEDWGAIYDMACDKEKGMQHWGRDEFVALMQAINAESLGGIEVASMNGDWQRQTSSKFFTLDITTGHGKETTLYVRLFRDFDDWHPAIAGIPLVLYTGGEKPTQERVRFLAGACDEAGIRTIVRLENRVEFSNERLGQYLKGELEWNEVSRPLPAPEPDY